MILNNYITKISGGPAYAVILCWLLLGTGSGKAMAGYYQLSIKDTTNKDSMVEDGMSVKIAAQNRAINLWNHTIPKLTNTATTSTIYGEDINNIPVSNVSNTLAGRLAGLYSVQSSGKTGASYDGATLTLQGQSPLLIIDGVVRSAPTFNPNEIKSITVLKDAVSANLFGLRSSNGIIYITTKDRSESSPFELTFSAQYGGLQQIRRPNFITGADYAKLYNEAQLNTYPGATPLYPDATIAAYENGTNDPYTQPNNNWYQMLYKSNSAQRRYTIDAAGNGRSYRFFLAGEAFLQGGNFLTNPENAYNTNNDYSRYNIRTNAQVDFNENIQLSLNLNGSFTSDSEPGTGATTIINNIFAVSPLAYPAVNADGSYGGNTTWTNNLLASTVSSGYNTIKRNTVSADVGLKFKLDRITRGLWLKGLASINNYYVEQINHDKTFAVYYPVITSTGTTYTKIGSDGTVSAGKGTAYVYTQNNHIYLNGMLGYSGSFGYNNLNVIGTYNKDNISTSYTQLNKVYQTIGVNADYDYNKKYLAQLGLSYNSLNRYPSDKWAFLPSVGLGWILSAEPFFKSKTVSLLKIRGSIGQTAWGDPTDYYSYLQAYSISATGYNFGTSATAVSGAAESTLANSKLTWEKGLKYDVGIETAFFNYKLSFDADYYNNKYYDQLIQPGGGYASGIIGQTYPLVNLGESRYTGFEGSMAFNSHIGTFGYFIKGNAAVTKSVTLDANEGNYPYPWMYHAGQADNAVYGYQAIGFYQEGEDVSQSAHILGYTPVAGDVKYLDLNGDGIINTLDQTAITGHKPFIFYGLGLGFNYKGFDVSALFQGTLNRENVFSASLMSAFYNSYGYVLDYTTENRWTPENSVDATLPRLTLGVNTNNTVVSTLWRRKTDYIRLKNAEIGYTFPDNFLNRARIKKLRVFVNAYNLLTFTSLKYFDPESGLSGFPNQRIINGGITLKL